MYLKTHKTNRRTMWCIYIDHFEMDGGDDYDTNDVHDPDTPSYVPEPPFLFDDDDLDQPNGSDPIYANASITVLTASAFIWSLAKNAAWRREDVEKLLHFIYNELLPRNNWMPSSMYRLCKIVGEPDMYDCTYRMCESGCFLWHRRDEERLGISANGPGCCPECKKALFTLENKKWVPICPVIYYGIASMIR